MNIKEAARKAGGEALVARIEQAAKIEKDVFAKVADIIEAAVRGLEGDDEKVALAAICEALSQSYANAAVVYTYRAFDSERSQGVLTAVKSLTNSMNVAFDDLDAERHKVGDRIKAAAAKGGQ